MEMYKQPTFLQNLPGNCGVRESPFIDLALTQARPLKLKLLSFGPMGRVKGRVDCNDFLSDFSLEKEKLLSSVDVACTKLALHGLAESTYIAPKSVLETRCQHQAPQFWQLEEDFVEYLFAKVQPHKSLGMSLKFKVLYFLPQTCIVLTYCTSHEGLG